MATASAAVRRARPDPEQVRKVGRVGLLGRATLMALLGVLVLSLAFGAPGGGEASPAGAIEALASQPFGTVLLAAFTLALLVYAGWQAARAWTNPERETGARGVAKRIAAAGRAVIYLGLAWLTVSQLLSGGSSGGGSGEGVTDRVMAAPAGRVLVALVGLGILAFALRQGYKGVRKDVSDEFRGDLGRTTRRMATFAARLGHFAHFIAYGAVAFFLIVAAWRYDSQEATGLDGALRRLAEQPYGTAVLGLTGAGFLAFAGYCLLLARYGRLVQDEE